MLQTIRGPAGPDTARTPRTRLARALVIVLTLALGACTTLPPNAKPDPRDRFERFNRSVYKFNSTLDHAVLRPVARTYVRVLPEVLRTHIENVLTNLAYPQTLINDFLQGKGNDGANDAARFVVNSVLGIAGIFDPATKMGLARNSADFGQTLGKWGMKSGPFLELPFLGPSDVRDTVGMIPDEYTNVHAYFKDPYLRWSLWTLDEVNARVNLLSTDALVDQAYDPYAFVRNVYLQRRDYLVNGTSATDSDLQDPEASGPDSPPPASTPPK